MEQHKSNIVIDQNNIPRITDNHLEYFRKALLFATTNYQEEIDRISNTDFSTLTPEIFYAELIWVINTSGFNAKIVSKYFNKLMAVYSDLQRYACGETLLLFEEDDSRQAMELCANKRKVNAAFKSADIMHKKINEMGWKKFRDNELNEPDKLQIFPFVGKITKYHLARNCGLLENIKPDLHLVRMAKHRGFSDPLEMCKDIQKSFHLPLGIVDLILWYSASQFGTK